MTEKRDDRYGRVEAADRAEWRAWLAANHDRLDGIWLVQYKKASGRPSVPYADSVEEALCFGWIDSLKHKLDAERSVQLFTPRRPRSPWSKLNKERVERLTADGAMTPAGLAKIEEAKRNGTWGSYDAIERLEIPDDLAAALAANPAAGATFRAFSPSETKQLLWHIASAKRPETRAKRIAEVVSNAEAGYNPLNWHQRKARERAEAESSQE